MIKLQAYAKINLALDVLRKREDGYHEVRMIMQTIQLHDNIDMTRTKTPGIQLSTNLSFLPKDENNLMYRAARLLMEEFGLEGGVKMKLRKLIPVAAGLAGGSADAAAVLQGMNRLFELGLSLEALQQRAVKLGADVPFCLMRGTALSEGIGERLSVLPPMPRCTLVLAKPPFGISTQFVYEHLGVDGLPESAHPRVDESLRALREGELSALAGSAGNILETVSCRHYPALEELKAVMRAQGALTALMSGSGPTVFGIFEERKAAEQCYRLLRFGQQKQLAKQVFITEPWR